MLHTSHGRLDRQHMSKDDEWVCLRTYCLGERKLGTRTITGPKLVSVFTKVDKSFRFRGRTNILCYSIGCWLRC